MMTGENNDVDEKFRSDDGNVLKRRQIFYYGWKEGGDIETVEEGYLVDGELYRPIEECDE